MPTVVEVIDLITEWAKAEICSKIRLKMPPKDDKESNSEGYDYTQIEPACFPFFSPAKINCRHLFNLLSRLYV